MSIVAQSSDMLDKIKQFAILPDKTPNQNQELNSPRAVDVVSLITSMSVRPGTRCALLRFLCMYQGSDRDRINKKVRGNSIRR